MGPILSCHDPRNNCLGHPELGTQSSLGFSSRVTFPDLNNCLRNQLVVLLPYASGSPFGFGLTSVPFTCSSIGAASSFHLS